MTRASQALAWAPWPATSLDVVGGDRHALLQRLLSQDLRPLAEVGRAVESLVTTARGKLVDWVEVIARPDALQLVSPAGRTAALSAWLKRYTIAEDVQYRAADPGWQGMHLMGPGWAEALGLQAPPPGHALAWGAGLAWPAPRALGPAGRLWAPAAQLTALREALVRRGGGAPLSAEAWELRRLQAGIPGPAGEYATEVNPLELRLDAAVGWNKGCYVGQEVLARLANYDKVARLTMGLVVAEGWPAEGPWSLRAQGRPLGRVTSWARQGAGVRALAVVRREAAVAQAVEVLGAAGAAAAGDLVDLPFWAGK